VGRTQVSPGPPVCQIEGLSVEIEHLCRTSVLLAACKRTLAQLRASTQWKEGP
jgi:hypothetical protein